MLVMWAWALPRLRRAAVSHYQFPTWLLQSGVKLEMYDWFVAFLDLFVVAGLTRSSLSWGGWDATPAASGSSRNWSPACSTGWYWSIVCFFNQAWLFLYLHSNISDKCRDGRWAVCSHAVKALIMDRKAVQRCRTACRSPFLCAFWIWRTLTRIQWNW